MKHLLLPVLLGITLNTNVEAQTMADVLNDRCKVTWIGLDFSEAKMIPSIEFSAVQADAGLALMKWNNLLEQEHEKFDLGKALGITKYTTNTSYVAPVNDGLSSDDLLSRDAYSLDKAKVPDMVKAYKTEGDGVGVVFIVSAFNKTQEMAEYYVTFFNMSTKEVLHSERIGGAPSGFGLRNYWAGSVMAVLKSIDKQYEKAWNSRFK